MVSDESQIKTFKNVQDYARILTKDAYTLSMAHFYRANYWGKIHLIIGITSIICSVSAGASFLTEYQSLFSILQFSITYERLAGLLAFFSSIIIAILTFIKPSKHEQDHYSAATSFISLYYEARVFGEVESLRKAKEEDKLSTELDRLIKEMNRIDKISPRIPQSAWIRAMESSKLHFYEGPVEDKPVNKRPWWKFW